MHVILNKRSHIGFLRTPCDAKSRQVGLSHCARNVLVYERLQPKGMGETSTTAAARQHASKETLHSTPSDSPPRAANNQLQSKITNSRVGSIPSEPFTNKGASQIT